MYGVYYIVYNEVFSKNPKPLKTLFKKITILGFV